MSRIWRATVFVTGAAGIAVLFGLVCGTLPGPLAVRNRYAEAINSRVYAQRNVTDAVSAVNFDYRGFDTVGEEFILFVSVLGSISLLRMTSEKTDGLLRDAAEPSRDVPASDAIRLWILIMIAPKVLFGIYIVTHGQLTPGGGFQGGVILATAALMLYLGESFAVFRKVVSRPAVEIAEAVGAGGFLLLGMIAWFWGKPFLTNVLPLGKTHELTSGGTMPLISLATGLEVTAGFVLLLFAFLEETLTVRGEE
ncbi:MAG TPA: MnhB domain-containing protein [Candidatus Acidoferrales bacterium]|nr:MnhB domain-containing protein [Candidatus Acidoferrales bacterium]